MCEKRNSTIKIMAKPNAAFELYMAVRIMSPTSTIFPSKVSNKLTNN